MHSDFSLNNGPGDVWGTGLATNALNVKKQQQNNNSSE